MPRVTVDPTPLREAVLELLSKPGCGALGTTRIRTKLMKHPALVDMPNQPTRVYQALEYLENTGKVRRLNQGRGRHPILWEAVPCN